jgi:hypothetical protein
VLAAAVIVLATLLKILLMLVDTPGIIDPAATATKPAIKAYSMRSWACVSLQIRSFQTLLINSFISPPKQYGASLRVSRQAGTTN